MLRKRVNLFGVFIDDIPLSHALEIALCAIEGGEQRVFFTPNIEFLNAAHRDEKIKELINCADVCLPDGIGLRLLSFILGKRINNTVPGIDFGEALFKLASKKGMGIFLLGGERGISSLAARELKNKHPTLKISGTHSGFFPRSQDGEVCKIIEKSGAIILIVCRGFPLQESFVAENKERLKSIRLFVCLGGAVDIWSGKLKRAPVVIRKIHLEWLWRLIGEPTRLKRFLPSLHIVLTAIKKKRKNKN